MNATLLEKTHTQLAETARTVFAAMEPKSPSWDDPTLSCKVAGLAQYGYLVPAAHGGKLPAIDVRSICVLREELAYRNPAADSVFAVQGLGSHPILLGGSAEQKTTLLSKVADGSALFAFALTEPEAGSDVAALATTAVKRGEGYVLNGQKRFISNAGIATHYTVFARTGEGPKGISAFIVTPGLAGFSMKKMELMGEHPIGELFFEGCEVPASARVGDEGVGMKLALSTLDVFRSTVGAAAVGMARRALDEAISYAKSRKQFGAPLSDLAAVQAMLAEMAVELEASRLLVHKAAATKDGGQQRVTYEAAVAKLFATEAAQRIIDKALQIHGGNGVVRGTVVERLYRDIRALRIYEGASEVQRLVIARHLLASR
ncbi:MAG: acyl-CoA dehydrogenase family protein [Myxococcaceae bacterium]|nr:acyl-CoA dehydrogenase family protein [Myxococcaceae bacterium]